MYVVRLQWFIQNCKIFDFVCTDLNADLDAFTDGLWHSVSIDIVSTQSTTHGKVNITVDGRPDISNRRLDFGAGADFYIGGISFLILISCSRYVGLTRKCKESAF